MFSIWILVTRACRDTFCGVFHHIDSQNDFATPSVFLTSSGRITETFPSEAWRFHIRPLIVVSNTSRPLTRPGERGKGWVVSVSLFLRGAFERVVPHWPDAARWQGENHPETQHTPNMRPHLLGVCIKRLLMVHHRCPSM